MSLNAISILIVDDHAVVRKGTSLLLQAAGFSVIATAENSKEALGKLEKASPNVVITDITMPGSSGMDFIQQVKKHYPSIGIIVLSMHTDNSYILNSFLRGALAYISKEEDESLILEAIPVVAMGRMFLTKKASEVLTSEAFVKRGQEKKKINLTKRETQTLKLIVDGLSNKMIAQQLNISEKTVGVHRYNLMGKLSASNTAELVRKTFELKLLM